MRVGGPEKETDSKFKVITTQVDKPL
jgi:hypothetical protein